MESSHWEAHANGWKAWAGFCGIPATLAAFAFAPALGFLTLAATVGAFWYGCRLERDGDEERLSKNLRQLDLRKQQDLQAMRLAWDEDYEKLRKSYDDGDLDVEDFEAMEMALFERYPR